MMMAFWYYDDEDSHTRAAKRRAHFFRSYLASRVSAFPPRSGWNSHFTFRALEKKKKKRYAGNDFHDLCDEYTSGRRKITGDSEFYVRFRSLPACSALLSAAQGKRMWFFFHDGRRWGNDTTHITSCAGGVIFFPEMKMAIKMRWIISIFMPEWVRIWVEQSSV